MKELAADKEDKIYKTYKETSKIAKGTKLFKSPQIQKEDIKDAESAKKDWPQKAKSKYKNAGTQAMTSYTAGTWRDLKYATMGRKYMRVLALTGANTAAAGRGYLVGLAQVAVEQ